MVWRWRESRKRSPGMGTSFLVPLWFPLGTMSNIRFNQALAADRKKPYPLKGER